MTKVRPYTFDIKAPDKKVANYFNCNYTELTRGHRDSIALSSDKVIKGEDLVAPDKPCERFNFLRAESFPNNRAYLTVMFAIIKEFVETFG